MVCQPINIDGNHPIQAIFRIKHQKGNACFHKADAEHPRAIEHFQKGETATFKKHIYTGLQILEKQPNSLLVFSG